MKTLLVITGPTGVGKTELCIRLAEHYGVEIINADSRQIYAEMPIGTAAPTAEQQSRVRHHFVGCKHIGEYYSASLYEQDVLKLLQDNNSCDNTAEPGARKDMMILAGGSMMYIDAVCNGIDDIPTIRDDIREMMKARLREEGLETMVEELHNLDPEYWSIVDRCNPRRVIHALEICHQTGKTYTSFRTGKKKTRPFNVIKIGLTVQREELYDRINRRVLAMMDNGLLNEVISLLPHRNCNALNTVGYKELIKYLDGEIVLEEAVRQIQSNTRQYARKQLTWYKRDEEMTWFSPCETQAIINFIDQKLFQKK